MNIKVVANQIAIQYNMLGLAASIYIAYNKEKEFFAKKSEEQKLKAKSEYVGLVGDRDIYSLTVKKIFTFENAFGISNIYSMVDKNNNVFIWKTGNSNLNENETYSLSGTIKEHQEYKGTKQTVLTRCKIK